MFFDKKIVLVTPWFNHFAGGAELLARRMAGEFNSRGVATSVFTTCAKSPYDSWWEDFYTAGVYDVDGIAVHRFTTNKAPARYHEVVGKIAMDESLTELDKLDFFRHGIGSRDLTRALKTHVDEADEIVALPYFQGLTHDVVNTYPGKISLIPCFHDEPQFYWTTTQTLLTNAKHLFFNSLEEREMTIKHFGRTIGRKIVESIVAGVGVELEEVPEDASLPKRMPRNYFVYVGRKERGKNVDLLCDWFARYVEEYSTEAKLVFLGGGDETLVPPADCFLDLGFVPEAVKGSVIRESKGVINLSLNESFSITIMEGWLLGVPVIVNAKCAVTKGHVTRADGGLYVENNAEFAAALHFLETRREESVALAANGRRYVNQEFSFDRVLLKYLREFVCRSGV